MQFHICPERGYGLDSQTKIRFSSVRNSGIPAAAFHQLGHIFFRPGQRVQKGDIRAYPVRKAGQQTGAGFLPGDVQSNVSANASDVIFLESCHFQWGIDAEFPQGLTAWAIGRCVGSMCAVAQRQGGGKAQQFVEQTLLAEIAAQLVVCRDSSIIKRIEKEPLEGQIVSVGPGSGKRHSRAG